VVFQPVAVVEESKRAQLIQNKSEVEIEGVRVSPDGQFVAWPTSPAAGWTAQLGTQSVLVDVDGTFAFQPPTDGATEGSLLHPSDPTIAYRFTTAQLAQAAGAPLVLPVYFPGPCGMQRGDILDAFCVPRPSVSPRSQLRPKLEGIAPSTLRPAPRFFQNEREMKSGPLGSYPNPVIGGDAIDTKAKLEKCPDTDGVLARLGDDAASLRYFFSTCHDFVQTNACLNENAGADILRIGSAIGEAALPFPFNQQVASTPLVLLRIPNPNPNLTISLHCYRNHKHRNCSQINLGDVACKLPNGTLVKPTGLSTAITFLLSIIGPEGVGFGTVEVPPGGSQTVTIHNNGAFGITKVSRIRNGMAGDLTGSSMATRNGVREIRHYLPLDYAPPFGSEIDATAYIPDQVVKYTAPATAQDGQVDSYLFLVDDRYVIISFKATAPRPFLRRLGSTDEVNVQDLNGSGTMTTLRGGKTLLEPLGQERVELLAQPGGALLNDQGHCLYQATDHQSHAKLRFPDGQELVLEPPPGSQSTFADGIVSLSPQGFYFCRAKRADGKNDFFTQVQGTLGRDFIRAPEGLSPTTEVSALPSTTTDALYANCPGGTATGLFEGLPNAGKLARFDFDTREWTSTVIPPRSDFLPAIVTNYVDATSSRVLLTSRGNNFGPAAPASGISYLNFFTFLVQSGAPFLVEHQSTVQGSSGSRLVASTATSIPAGTGPDSNHTVIAMNEDGEVAGTFFVSGVNRPVLFPVVGERKDLVSLLPPGAPAGTWMPLKMAGNFMVLVHTDGSGQGSLYLWLRGPG